MGVARLNGYALQFKRNIVDQSAHAISQDVSLCSRGFISIIYNMKQYLVVALILLVAALAAPTQGIAARDRVIADPGGLGETNYGQFSSSTLRNDVPIQTPIVTPSASASSPNFQDIPSVSGRYAIGERTLLPYIGAGFSGGYSSEFNRSLGGGPSALSDFGLRSQLGHSVSPNEFQLGIRIPF
ncbi:hypothetical protein AYO43_07890 [Nitrospira sp. SCGC AG-212-E16]|nr:hypothetical protein AYO43_07890 [Nitrospira sp. SCGC AG-212-E16]